MASYSLVPLHTRPDFVDDCIQLLQVTWPYCKPGRLRQLEGQKSCKGLPCSLVLTHQVDGGDRSDLPGHIRLIPVTSEERAVYAEALCIDVRRRGEGLGKKLMAMAERYAAETLGCSRVFMRCRHPMKGFYLGIGYADFPADVPVHTVGGNVLRTIVDVCNWYGNVPEPGWEFVHVGHEGSREEMESGMYGQNTLVKSLH